MARQASCPICDSPEVAYAFRRDSAQFFQCHECDFLFQPSNESTTQDSGNTSCATGSRWEGDLTSRMRRIERCFKNFERYCLGRKIVTQRFAAAEVCVAEPLFRSSCEARGMSYSVIEFSPSFTAESQFTNVPTDSLDLVLLPQILEKVAKLKDFLGQINRVLRPGGLVLIVSSSVDSYPARALRDRWSEFRKDQPSVLSTATVGNLLFLLGFEQLRIWPGQSLLGREDEVENVDRFLAHYVAPLVNNLGASLPVKLRKNIRRLFASGMQVIARKSALPPPTARQQLLTVVLPAYNEKNTFGELMALLLAKTVPGLAIEIVIVESNSTDGTREMVQQYASDPRIKVIYQERPSGKGHAVRAGLEVAQGDYILIQDADLEYDLNDYDELLEPLRRGQRAFVLGSRHTRGSTWKIRHFADQKATSSVLNFGHLFFRTLFNLTYGTSLGDPFTMYKVFRRDCLHDLWFECNRFDFDIELAGKLIRAGFRPIEIPINYQSRSFAEGKKVSFWQDPPTWVRACLKYRLLSPRKF